MQIAHELQERLPRVLDGMTLSNLWAYKFDSDTRCLMQTDRPGVRRR